MRLNRSSSSLLNSVSNLHITPDRSVSFSQFINGASSTAPGTPPTNVPPQYTYLGYLSNAFTAILTNTNPFGAPATPSVEAPTKAAVPAVVSAERVIARKVSRTEVTNKTRALIKRFMVAESSSAQLMRIQELSAHITSFPPTRVVAAQEAGLIAELLRLESEAETDKLREESRQCLTLCGYQPQLRSRGINLLSVDGGGTRGMMGLEVLEEIERVSGKKICELFDHIVGVSTGGIIAALLGVKRLSVKESREIYMDISKRLFAQTRLQGVGGLLWSHSYYDTKKWVQMLKSIIGESCTMIDSSRLEGSPRLSIISSIVNLPVLQPYVFRSYEPPAGRDSHYRGGTQHYLWQAIQASAAAPLYFEEVQLGSILHQDGGVIANNPCAIAVHETKLLWPDEPLHCVVSVGNGRTVVELEPAPTVKSTNISQKMSRIIDSATNTEAVHMSMHDLLDQSVYYRLNPYMSYTYGLDEINPERLIQMQNDAKLYVRRNSVKIESAAKRLTQDPTISQKLRRSYRSWQDRRGSYVPH